MDKNMTEATKYLRHCRETYGPNDLRTRAAFAARAAEVESEQKPQFGVWYLSFATEDKFLGAVFLHAHSVAEAIHRSVDKGINPGGEVLAMPPNDGTSKIPGKFLNVLLSKADLDAMDKELGYTEKTIQKP